MHLVKQTQYLLYASVVSLLLLATWLHLRAVQHDKDCLAALCIMQESHKSQVQCHTPSSTDLMSALVSSYTCSWLLSGPNTLSYLYCLRLLVPGFCIATCRSVLHSVLCETNVIEAVSPHAASSDLTNACSGCECVQLPTMLVAHLH